MRCAQCKKKQIILLICACGKEVCIYHRMPEQHVCTKEKELVQLEKLIKEKIIKV